MAILSKSEARTLYDSNAGRYDAMLILYRLAGLTHHRKMLVQSLQLQPGAVVVDLCCGTGANLFYLSRAVGPAGKVLAVDLSAGMLERARQKIAAESLQNVELICGDVEEYQFPGRLQAVVSTFGLEMVPAYGAVVQRIAAALPEGGRLGLLGLQYPENWPGWCVDLGMRLNRPFGVSREYRDFKPWQEAELQFDIEVFRNLLFGTAYFCLATRKTATRGRFNSRGTSHETTRLTAP